MTDVATLGFSVDTGPVRQAQNDLRGLEQTSKQIETTAERMARQFNQAMQSIQQSVKGTINAYNQLDTTINLIQAAFYAATGNMAGFSRESAKVFAQWSDEAKKAEKEASKLTQSMTLLQKALVFAGVGVGIGQLIEYTDIYGRMSAQLSQSTKSQADYNDALASLYQIAQQTGQGVESVVQLYSRMARSTKALEISQSQLLDVTSMVNKMLMMAQLPAASAEAALFQFSQAMSSGTLRGEELNSILEQMPPLAEAIATGMGITTGQLRKLGEQGLLTSKNVMAAILSQKDAINGQFDAMMGGATTMSNLMSRADNAMVMLIGRADELGGATLALQGAFAALNEFLDSPDTASTLAIAFEKIGIAIKVVVDMIAAALPYLDEFFGIWLGAKGLAALASLAAGIFVAYIKFELLQQVIVVVTAAITKFGAVLGLTAAQIAAMTGVVGRAAAALSTLQKVMAFTALVGGIMTAISAVAMLASGVLLFSDTTTDAQEATTAYRDNLNLLGRTADEVAASFAKMTDEQKKNAIQQTELTISKQQTSLSSQSADIEAYLKELLSDASSAFSYRDGIVSILDPKINYDQYLEGMRRMNEALANNGAGMASFIEWLKKAGIAATDDVAKLVTFNGALQSQREELIKAEATLRILTNTRRGDEEATLGQTTAMNVQTDALAKNTEELIKNIAKLKEKATTAGMTEPERIGYQGESTNLTEYAINAGQALATLNKAYEDYNEARKRGDAVTTESARQAALAAEAQYLEATRVDASTAAWKQYQKEIQAGNMGAAEAMRMADEAGQREMEAAKQKLAVLDALARQERNVTEEAKKASEQQITGLQETNKYTQLQTDLLAGVATQWAGLNLSDSMASLTKDLQMPDKEAAKALMEYAKIYDETLAKTGDTALAAQSAQETLNQAIVQYEQNVQGAINAEQQRSEEMARTLEIMEFQKQAMDSLNSSGQANMSWTFGNTGVQMQQLATSTEQIEAFYQNIKKLDAEMRQMGEQGLPIEQQAQRIRDSLKEIDQDAIKKIQNITASLDDQRKILEKNAPTWAELTGQVKTNSSAQETAAALSKIVVAGNEAEEKSLKAKAIASQQALEETKKLQAVMVTVADYYQKSLTPMERYTQELKKIEEAQKLLDKRKDQGIISPKQLEEERRGLEQWREEAEQLKSEADPMAQAFKSAAEGIYNAWSGMWESLFTQGISGFDDVVEQIKTMFLKMLAQMAAAALAKPILLPIVQTMGGMMGLDNAGMAPIVNNIFGAGTMGAGATSGGGMSNLFGLGSLFGGSSGGSLSGFLGMDGTLSMFGSESLGSLVSGIGSVFSSVSSFIPVIGLAIGAISMLTDLFSGTPHPSSIATAGGFWNSENGPLYGGKGGTKEGASGILYGYDWGHTDPAEAAKIRDAFMEIDQALTDLAPTVDLAGVKLGEFGQTAEGFIANGEYVADMDAVTAGFVQAWVNAAAEQGAVSELVNAAFQSMTGTAEELLTAFSALQQMDAAGLLNQQMIDIALALETGADQLTAVLTALGSIQGYAKADPLADFEKALADSLKTTFDRLGDAGAAMAEGVMDDAGKVIADGLAQVDWADATSIQELAGLVQQRYALEIQMITEIQGYLTGLAQNFAGSIEEIQLSVMDNAQKYEYFAQQAADAFAALETATDPAEMARLAEEARQAAMSAYGLLDDSQKQQASAEFVGFLEETQALAAERLNAAQQQVMDEHRATAELLANALQQAGEAAAAAISRAAEQLADATQSIETGMDHFVSGIENAFQRSSSVSGMAAGGFVGGSWNGQAGRAGDTVATMLTPGEAVISREQTQKHHSLIASIMADDVRYAARGFLPPMPLSSSASSSTSGSFDSGSSAEVYHDQAEAAETAGDQMQQLNELMAGVARQIDEMNWGAMQSGMARVKDEMEASLQQAMELGASEDQLNQIRSLAELQIQQLQEELIRSFDSSLEEIQLSTMTDAEKYAHYTEVAESAFDALRTATDPSEIERLAQSISDATMTAWGLLDDSQRESLSQGFQQFLVDAQELTRQRLATVDTGLGQDIVQAGQQAAQAITNALQTPITVDVNVNVTGGEAVAMAAGGFVGGSWNGQSGIAGDTVATMLTPGEAVIPRDRAQKHRSLIAAIVSDNVRYAALGQLPSANLGGSWSGTLPDWRPPVDDSSGGYYGSGGNSSAAEDAARNAEQLADLIKRLTREFRDLTLEDFDRQLAKFTDTLADTQAQITELGGSAAAAALAQQIATEQERQLREEQARQQTEFLQPYRDAAVGLRGLDAALLELDRRTQAQLTKAGELGITDPASLALITDEAGREAERIRGDLTAQVDDLMAGFSTEPLKDYERALAELADQVTEAKQTADDLNLSTEQRHQIDQWATQQAAQIEQERADSLAEVLAGVAEPLGALDQQMQDLRASTDATREQAKALGATYGELQTINRSYLRKMEEIARAAYEERSAILATYATDGPSDFEKSIAQVWKEAAQAQERFMELGGSLAEAAAITEGAAAMEAKLREERAQALTAVMDGFSLETLSAFEQQLADVAKRAAEGAKQAADLGASQEQLTQIEMWAAQETKRLADERQQALADFMIGFDIGPTAGFKKALYDMGRQLDANIQQAESLGATEEEVAKIRAWTSEQAVQMAQSAIDQEIDTFEQAATAVAQTLEQITNSLRQLKDGIEANLLDMNRLQPDWNEVTYQTGRVTDLKGQLATSDGLPLEQRISLVEQLRAAVMNRYQAEMTAQQELQQEQEKADTEQRQNLEKLVQIAKNLKSYLDSLKLSDLSTLSPEQKLSEAQRQYQDTLGKAQSGDIDAQGELQGAAQAYLSEARNYYASTEAYAGIFNQVTATLTTLESLWRIQGEGGLAALDQPLTRFETESLAFADAAAQELETLLPLLSAWQAEATATATAETAKLRSTLNANTSAITSAVTASGLIIGSQLSAAIAAMTATVAAALQAQAAQLQAAQAQAIASQQAAASAAAAPKVPTVPTAPTTSTININTSALVNATKAVTPAPTTSSRIAALTRRAGGGYTDPGWAMVGEEGPELVNFAAPSRVYTAADTLRMMSDNDSSEDTESVVLELKTLVRLQSAANQQLIAKLDAVETRLAGIESKARLEAAA